MKAKLCSILLLTLFLVSVFCLSPCIAQEYIAGPWLWMIAPTEPGLGGANSTDVDSLAVASDGDITEIDVATNGAHAGDFVGNYAWTLDELRFNDIENTYNFIGDIDNLTDLFQKLGGADGEVFDHSAYALITLESAHARNGVTMNVGSDDSIKMWLNGEVVHKNPVDRGSGGYQDTFQVNLKQGDNLLLVKVSQAWGNWSMFVGVDADVKAAYKAPLTEMEKVTLLLDWFPNVDHAPLYVAQQNKTFAKHGLEVELRWGGDPNAPLKLVAAGKYPFAVSYQQSVTIARASEEELPVKSIGLLVEHPLNTISFLKKSGIKTPADFKGRKIGYTVAPLDVLLFHAIAANAGLTEDEYELINIGTNIMAPLLSGQIDAVIGPFRNYEINMLKLEGAEADFFALEKHGIPDYYELVIITNDAYLEKHPKIAKKLMMAIQEAIQFTKKNPDKALQLFFQANPKAPKELEKLAFRDTLDLFATTQVQSKEKWDAFTKFALEKGLISKSVKVEDLFINLLEEKTPTPKDNGK
ncbi:MAG: ABC transporter substrate-binding protein [Candidatus Poribacteria bacterium]|nr:ABC transporter substrate-binding protein [Candidatus Poribacteria bacterium]